LARLQSERAGDLSDDEADGLATCVIAIDASREWIETVSLSLGEATVTMTSKLRDAPRGNDDG
jgi:hypothetical protein